MTKQLNNSYIGLRKDILKHVSGENLNILDVGCATGVNGRWLKENKKISYLSGIEIDATMSKIAAEVYDELILGNIESLDLSVAFNGNKFDFILLGDVLEHLIDPWSILKKLNQQLNPGGKIIISLPNIQHINTFFNIYIRGEWVYNERGIYDKTHLRWFTLKNIKKLTSAADLKIIKVHRNFRFRDALGSKFPPGTKFLLTFLFRNLFTFQYIVITIK